MRDPYNISMLISNLKPVLTYHVYFLRNRILDFANIGRGQKQLCKLHFFVQNSILSIDPNQVGHADFKSENLVLSIRYTHF